MAERLIPEVPRDLSAVGDFMMEIARNIEGALLHSGAVPVKDYTYMDLCQLSLPIVADMWQRERLQYTISDGSLMPGPPEARSVSVDKAEHPDAPSSPRSGLDGQHQPLS